MTQFIDEFSREIWEQTYKDHTDNTVDDTFRRVASALATVEKTEEAKREWEEKFYDMMSDFKGGPGGRTFANAGTEFHGTTLLNCFLAPRAKENIDSLEGIIKDLNNQAMTLKSEGGWGQNFSFIRPRGAFINGIGVASPGAIKYMELYDKSSEIVTAGSGKKSENKKAKGKIRKGAMLGALDCTHPDIIEFITAKQQSGRLTKFNISINCTNEFMDRLIKLLDLDKNSEEFKRLDQWNLRFPDTTFERYNQEWDGNLKNWETKGYPVKIYQTVSATWLWNLIMESTYNRAEPGVLFLDRANEYNPGYYFESIQGVNPCGEQTLSSGNVCCLGTLNLTQFVDPKTDRLDLEKLKKYARIMVRLLDNVNEYSSAPLPEYVDSMRNKRRIGCGLMGWGSACQMMKIKFGSRESSAIRDELMETYARTVYETSIDLAEERGMFTYCDPEKHAAGKFVQSLGLSDEYMTKLRTTGIRNSSLLSMQPNGGSGIFFNIVSGGIEPIFMAEYIRTVIVPVIPPEIIDVTPKFYEGEWHETALFKFAYEGDEQILKGTFNGVTYKIDKSRGLLKEVACKDYSVRYLESRGEWDPNADYSSGAMSGLTPDDHLNDLIGFAKRVDSAISKTIVLPNEVTFEDFKDIYMKAYKSGYIKGVTTYRAGTMAAVLSVKETENNGYEEEVIIDSVKMPASTEASMKTLKADGKKWYLTVVWNETKTRPQALFVHTNHHEKSVTTHDAMDRLLTLAREKKIPEQYIESTEKKIESDTNATKITRVISLLLRHGVAIKNIIHVLSTIDNVFVGSFLFQITKFLATFIRDGEVSENEKCPECGAATIVYQEGCKVCATCGNSKCG